MLGKEELWPAELLLWNAMMGENRAQDPEPPEGTDQATSSTDRRVRAQLIRQFAMGCGGEPKCGSTMIALIGNEIVGDLDLEAASVLFPLIFDHCVIGGINLDQAEAPGLVVINSTVKSLTAHQLQTGNVYLKNTTILGKVGLNDAHLRGFLNLIDAHFTNPDVALNAHNIKVDGDMLARNFRADGEVDLTGARIGGFLQLEGATLLNSRGPALMGDCLSVGQDMLCQGLTSHGEIRLLGAHITGRLYLAEALIESASSEVGHAFSADFLTVGRDMECCDVRAGSRPFRVDGQLRLPGADIGGRLDLGRARITNEGQKALFARRINVSEDLKCNDGFTVEGETNLVGAKVGGRLNFQNGNFKGLVNLESATAHRLVDAGTAWPEKITLGDFEYNSFSGIDDAGSVEARLSWLKLNTNETSPPDDMSGYSPQIYNRLAEAYRADGQDDAAREVLIAKLRARSDARRRVLKRARNRSRLRRFTSLVLDRFLDWTVGYGYRPMRILWWFFGMLLLGIALLTYLSSQAGDFKAKSGISPVPVFHAPLQALDLLLPVAGIGQRGNFLAMGAAVWYTTAFILMGWLFGLILVAGLSGVFKRD